MTGTVMAQSSNDRYTGQYGQPGYGNQDYGYNRGYYGNDWRNRDWDGHGSDDFRFDHEFWRGRWRDELGLSRTQRREMERIDNYYDRFRIDARDPRFRQVQRQKFQQRSIVLSRVQPPRGQYGYGNRGNGPYRRPGYGRY
jgi:hypothetical protein